MIQFERFSLENGLKVIVHKDDSSPMLAVNVLYNVGARDEQEEKTGFAHLFEHLMFGGSVNIPDYDEPLQMAGGENNAYTTNDITNYYIQIPKENLETALWLESDRMLSLAFDENSLEVQRKVVSEEFKEHYLNKPYGDVWMHLREMAYEVHPYKWMTIGKELSHIENATLEDVKSFFNKFYNPSNAVLCIAGDVVTEDIKALVQKWFGDIPAGPVNKNNIPQEPKQISPKTKTVTAEVPLDALYKVWHIAGRLDPDYYPADIITEILGTGDSSRLYQTLVKDQQLFSYISCYHTGSQDPGLLVIEGKIAEGVTIEIAEAAVNKMLDDLIQNGVTADEVQKTTNQLEVMVTFEDMSLLARANNLAYYEMLGDAELMNQELDNYNKVTALDIQNAAKAIFVPENSCTLYYLAKKG